MAKAKNFTVNEIWIAVYVAAIHVNWAQSHHQSFSKRSTWALFCGKFCHFCCFCLIHLLVQNLQYILNVFNIFWAHLICFGLIPFIWNVFPIFCTGFHTFCTWSKVRFYLKDWHFNVHDWRCTKYIEYVFSKSIKWVQNILHKFKQILYKQIY